MSRHLRVVRPHWSPSRITHVALQDAPPIGRRLRRSMAPGPKWVIKVDGPVTPEVAHKLRQQWLAAGRAGVAVVSGNITVMRGGR